MKAQYFVPDQGEDITDARGDFIIRDDFDNESIRMVAEEAAEYERDNCDGWEWMDKDGEITVAIVVDGSYVGRCMVTIEFEPTYFAEKPFDMPGEPED